MRTSRRTTVRVVNDFAFIATDKTLRVVLQSLDLELHLKPTATPEMARATVQLLNALVESASAELVDWSKRGEDPST